MRRLWALLGLASGVVAAASCPYTSLGGSAVLASDTNCGSDVWCLLSPGNCSRLSYTYFASTDSFWDVQAIGDLTNYVKDGLFVQSAPLALDLSQMVLPSALQRLRLRNVASLSLSQITSPWPALTCLELINCNLVRFSSSFAFPPGLKSLYITKNKLVRVPSNLPASIRKLGLQGNAITSLNGLPPTVINLDASFNQLTDVSNVDWRAVTSVDLSNNPLTALANVRLASRLTYFNIANCSIVNVTIDAETFNALDALAPSSALKDDRGYYRYDPDNNVIYVGYKVTSTIYTDTAACEANHGSIRELWATTSEYDVRVCVVASPGASASLKSDTDLIAGLVVGGLVIVGLVIFFIKRRQSKKETTTAYRHAPPTPQAPYVYVPPEGDDLGFQPLHSPSFGSPEPKSMPSPNAPVSFNTLGGSDDAARGPDPLLHSSLTHGSSSCDASSIGHSTVPSSNAEDDVYLDVAPLRNHKLELLDLVVASETPWASGAHGEIWLGIYVNEKVAIKRVRDRSPARVLQFIEEIKLLSRIQSDYIVKFVGASWRRPIEIECVVEYMDLGDLRNYLATNSPASFSWDQKLKSIVSIVRGLVYLHTFSPPIIHRDLKSRNVLLDSKKGTKLTDFGSSREIDESTLTNGVGTYQWMAPEIIIGTEYTVAADIYSFGVILSEFSTHNVPYSDLVNPGTGRMWNQQYIITKVTTGQLMPTLDETHTPVWVREMAAVCLQNAPESRPTSVDLALVLQRL